jgi:hypothetical protein
MTTLTTYPLRLPKSIKAAAERLSKADGTSLNQFVATAVAEKIAVMEAMSFFDVRAGRAQARAALGEPSVLLAALARAGGEPPREDDEWPTADRSDAAPEPAARKRVAAKAEAKPARAPKKRPERP